MLKTKKLVVDVNIISKLIETYPDITVLEAVKMIKRGDIKWKIKST